MLESWKLQFSDVLVEHIDIYYWFIYRYDEMTNPGYGFNNQGWNKNPGTGYYNQVVWNASTQLGIGKAIADDGCVYVCLCKIVNLLS